MRAPIKGNAGVFVLQVYGKDKLNDTFNAKDEEATLTNMHARFASRLMNDLYLKGNVKDTRYLFFKDLIVKTITAKGRSSFGNDLFC